MGSSENGGSNKRNISNDAQEDANIYEDEIDLRDYIQVIVKRKKLIIGIFLIAVITAAMVSLLLPKVYEASASIMVMPSKIQSALSPTRISLDPEKTEQGEYVAQKPTISIPTHKTLLKSNAVLARVMNRLKSAGKLDEDLALEELFEKLQVADAKETNILQLVAKDEKPGLAKDTVNIWADEYAQYSLGIITGEVKGSGKFVEDQFKLVTDSLVEAEQAVENFDVTERFSLMQIELKENDSQLEKHYAKIHKLDFTLKEKKNQRKKIDDDISAMTREGIWLGAFNVEELGEKYFVDEALSPNQKALRQKTLKAKVDLENDRKKRDSFVSDSKIMLLRAEVERKRTNIVNDKARLAQIKQLSESTKANLNSKTNLDMLKSLQNPIAENLPELTVWEILSLMKGYNFFETRGQSLASKLEQQENEVKALEKVVLEHNDTLKTLEENLSRAQANYDFYHGWLKALQSQKNSLEMEIAKVEFELSYSREMVDKLEGQVKVLKVAINEKKARLTELNRQLGVCKSAYATLASKIEEARIAKAMELGEVKVVSTAFEPRYPIAPRKKLIVAIAGVVSLMLGVFMAFFLEFWQKNEDVKPSKAQSS